MCLEQVGSCSGKETYMACVLYNGTIATEFCSPVNLWPFPKGEWFNVHRNNPLGQKDPPPTATSYPIMFIHSWLIRSCHRFLSLLRPFLFHKRGTSSVLNEMIHIQKITLKCACSYEGHTPDSPMLGRSDFNHHPYKLKTTDGTCAIYKTHRATFAHTLHAHDLYSDTLGAIIKNWNQLPIGQRSSV